MAKIAAALGQHAEDIALASGAALVGTGVALAVGIAFGMVSFGTLCIAYGVWITERGR